MEHAPVVDCVLAPSGGGKYARVDQNMLWRSAGLLLQKYISLPLCDKVKLQLHPSLCSTKVAATPVRNRSLACSIELKHRIAYS